MSNLAIAARYKTPVSFFPKPTNASYTDAVGLPLPLRGVTPSEDEF